MDAKLRQPQDHEDFKCPKLSALELTNRAKKLPMSYHNVRVEGLVNQAKSGANWNFLVADGTFARMGSTCIEAPKKILKLYKSIEVSTFGELTEPEDRVPMFWCERPLDKTKPFILMWDYDLVLLADDSMDIQSALYEIIKNHVQALAENIYSTMEDFTTVAAYAPIIPKTLQDGREAWKTGLHIYHPDIYTSVENNICARRMLMETLFKKFPDGAVNENGSVRIAEEKGWRGDTIDENIAANPQSRMLYCHKCAYCDCKKNNVNCEHATFNKRGRYDAGRPYVIHSCWKSTGERNFELEAKVKSSVFTALKVCSFNLVPP